ncbi:LysR family transcriptional regulator [Streptomyces kunmingensis]|uniref:LysR family transcriptional regulator n=1 Tax=Streptomyces kunmingensis TaxID=68225 RepID=A0ABU6CFW6_9ACTN|nr:LysR family transcriptional regulator [Streptomyces kunmingensis]MEB3963507.1 LysR family transcriptional regulator [Streptomyces kunmingensis]
MDLETVRTVVAVAEEGQFQVAAQELGVSQQAVSKRVAALEAELGVRLFTRVPRGARLTLDGQAFLPHAKAVLRALEKATASVRPGRRPLRVDVMGTRVMTAGLLQDFHRAHPEVALDVVALGAAGKAVLAAVRDGSLDAAFWARRIPEDQLPPGVRSERVVDEPILLVTGTGHPLAGADAVTPADLAGHRIRMPGLGQGTEWGAYYGELADDFGLDIDVAGPNFGADHLLQTVADSATVATFMGPRTPLAYPAGLELRMIPVHRPTPVYPHSLLRRDDNPHPGLAALRAHLLRAYSEPRGSDTWVPAWAR